MNLTAVLNQLKKLKNPEAIASKKRFGIVVEGAYGIFLKDLRVLAKEIGKNDPLALELFDSGVYEARLLVPMLFNHKHLTSLLMEKWVQEFDTWEICDSFCMGFFGASKFAVEKALQWAQYPGEFQKRAAFACMASYSLTNKEAPNPEYQQFFPILIEHANDPRKYVMKAINWALRQIGKRNRDLCNEAIKIAHHMLQLGTKTSKWIAKDALRELQGIKVSIKNYPRSVYGKN